MYHPSSLSTAVIYAQDFHGFFHPTLRLHSVSLWTSLAEPFVSYIFLAALSRVII